jgi:hypothetical protein
MDFDKLLEPYTENGRTISGQIKWLVKNALPIASVDYAMSAVYKRIENGEVFKDGDALDQELRRVTKEHYETELVEGMKKRIGEVESNLDIEWNKLGRIRKTYEVWFKKA